jgi:hypothetical protein
MKKSPFPSPPSLFRSYNGIACESPDKVATIFIEVTSAKGVDALIDENIDWLTKDQGVQLDKASEQKQDFEGTEPIDDWQFISPEIKISAP